MAKQNNELLQRIKTLEDIEQKEYEDMGAAMKNLQENVKSLTQWINQVKDFQHHHQLEMSPDLVQAEEMTTSISQRIQWIAGFHQSQHAKTRSALQQARESLKSLWESSSFQNSAEATEDSNTSQSTGRNHQQNQNQNQSKTPSVFTHFFSRQKTATNTETQEQKSDLKMEEEKHLCQRTDMIEKDQQEQHQKIRDYLNQVEKEVRDVQWRICHIEATQQQKLFEIRLKEKDDELKTTRSVLKEKEEELKFFKDRLKEKDEELQATRSVLNKKEEELKSFKDRVALEVAPSIKTGNTMSLNSPVSKNRIREMYETLRCDWPKIKEDLKLAGEKPDSVQKMILKQFTSSRTDMEEKKNVMISNIDELNKPRHGTESPEVKEYSLLAIQDLQLAIYNQKYDNDSQKPLSAHEVTNHKDMMEYLSSECYWLGCLMALNNPPINPDWENHPASMDKWDILPRNITAPSVKK